MKVNRRAVTGVRDNFCNRVLAGAVRRRSEKVEAMNGALFPGRVPHVRQSVHPDFLWTLLALANFMRLSLMKAAYADVGGAPCRKSGYMGRKDGRSPFQRFCYIGKKTAAKSQNPPPIE
jgi:hypothetical protein